MYRRRPGWQKRLLRLIVLIFSAGLAYFLFSSLSSKASFSYQFISPVASGFPFADENVQGVQRGSDNNNATLEARVREVLEGTKGTYSVAVKNLKTGESFYLDENKEYDSGSLYKLWVMTTVYDQIKKGALKEDQVLSQDIKTLNRKFSIDEEVAEQTEGGITQTVAQALKQMITISHNYAALLLAERVRLSTVGDFLKAHGLNDSKVGTATALPKTTARDTALFFEKLYRGELGEPEHTTKMLDLLKAQTLNKKIPKNLPSDIVVAHKTGELGQMSHDGGIVYAPKGDYIIVVMSQSTIPAAANDRIADISKVVYDYFQNQK